MKGYFVRLVSAFMLVFVFCLLPGITMAADKVPHANPLGDYTALGDSIAFGYGDISGKGYVGLVHDYLAGQVQTYNLQLNNLGFTGNTSSRLLETLRTDEFTKEALGRSRFVTVNIGGNNLLGPVIAEVSKAFNVKTADSSKLAADIEAAFANDPDLLFKLAALLRPDGLPAALEAGALQFEKDWPLIIDQVRQQAPEAVILVSTVYNPMKPDAPFFAIFDRVVKRINEAIRNDYEYYKVVDVYSAFREYKGSEPLTGFNLFGGSLDPHPTEAGYRLIYSCHSPVLEEALEASQDGYITRADALMYLFQLFGVREEFRENFSDVDPEDYFYNAAGTAKKLGISNGAGRNRFVPDAAVSRQDLMVFTGRLIQKLKLPCSYVSSFYLARYEDNLKLPSYARSHAALVLGNDLLKLEGSRIEPSRAVTKVEFFQLLERLAEVYEPALSVD